MKRKVTIADVAAASGVSVSAVSYALNDKKGVSPSTREAVLEVARELGWKPNRAARALSASRSRTVGLVMFAAPDVLATNTYLMEFLSGLGIELELANYSVTLRQAHDEISELAVIKDWVATSAVDGVVVLNPTVDDQRITFLHSHPEVPAVVVSDQRCHWPIPAIEYDDSQGVRLIVEHLAELGHRRIARIAGPEQLAHTFIRDQAFFDEATRLDLRYTCRHADYTPQGAVRATQQILSFNPNISAIVYDNDTMAMAGLGQARRMGLKVPQSLSIVSWDDSFLCDASTPSLTSLTVNIQNIGRRTAHLLLNLIEGCGDVTREVEPYTLSVRESSAPQRVSS